MEDNSKYREIFLEESDEYLQVLNDGMLLLEDNPTDSDALNDIFRAAHTLKGMAATMGYNSIATLTHNMETAFELFRGGKNKINQEIISIIFKTIDKLSENVEMIRNGDYSDVDIEELVKALSNTTDDSPGDSIGKVETNDCSDDDTNNMIIREAKRKGFNAFKIKIILEKETMLKAARAYLVVNRLEQDGDIIQITPTVEELEAGNFDNEFSLLYLTKLVKEDIMAGIDKISEIEEVSIEEINHNELDEEYSHAIYDKNESTNQKVSVPKSPQSSNLNHSIRVDLVKLDHFMNLVSELVIYRNQLEDISDKLRIAEINEPLANVARISSDLQELVLKIRMQPLSIVFDRFPRIVRDLSKELNKHIDFQIEGDHTELDRIVVSELNEPFLHLIRNAADHGIETSEKRVDVGKPEQGLIRLIAYQEGNRVIINLSDDGNGIDPNIIREAAIRKGIEAESLNDTQLMQLIFNPGFSTNKEVTSVSGRGVGMDVVKQKINSLGGTIEVSSEIGKGTNFIIKLPLTLSIIQSLMVKVSGEVFAIPLGLVEKVVRVTKEEILETYNKEVYIYQGKSISVVRVDEKLGLAPLDTNKHLILVHLGDDYYGLLVDELLGQQEIVIKKLSGVLGKMKEYLGATILGNGNITLILDVGNICGGV
ncbi:MAG: chemotaxis protein CheA [Gudongella sp.]|nr:chemotaxis protein CheA [Gudongella sp.]